MKVTLKQPHRHNDKVYAEGESPDLPAHDVEWLRKHAPKTIGADAKADDAPAKPKR